MAIDDVTIELERTAVDAVHFALHELGVQHDVNDETPVAVRSGPRGLVGVYVLPPNELVELAESAVERRFTEAECESILSAACPPDVEIAAGLPLRGGSGSYGATDPGLRSFAGTTVTMEFGQSQAEGFGREVEAFTERTGINIRMVVGESDRPDVIAYNPEREQLRALDISEFVDGDTLRSDFGEYLLAVGTFGSDGASPSDSGPIRAIPLGLDLKGMVLYPKAEFEAAGYEVPESWDELVAVSRQILADGGTPWCFAFNSGGIANGWPGTDLLESLVLRVGGADIYDAWTLGEVGFTSPAMMEAGRLADALIFEPGFVRGGPAAISNAYSGDQLSHMLQRNAVTGEPEPACWMHFQAGFLFGLAPAGTRIGEDVDFFVLPPVDPSRPTPTTGGGGFAAALVDRPEVRAFTEFIASPEWGEVWARTDGTFMPANQRFEMSGYGDPTEDPAIAVRIAMASEIRAALAADVFRFDASDLMPAAIGGSTEEDGRGAFWQGMLDWVDETRPIDQVFADIDAEWAALEAQGEP